MKRFGGLFGMKKVPSTDRRTRASTSSQPVRQSYHEGFELLELLASEQDFKAVHSMVFLAVFFCKKQVFMRGFMISLTRLISPLS